MRLRNSLLAQYVLIVLFAIMLLPLVFPLVTMALVLFSNNGGGSGHGPYQNGLALERMWHEEAGKLGGAPASAVDGKLRELKGRYPEASMFWVDGESATRLQLPENGELPAQWTADYTVRFMKERSGGDPFTVVAFIGETDGQENAGFMVLEVPRAIMKPEGVQARDSRGTIFVAGTLLALALFLLVSLLFFYRIRRRLVRLQTAMTSPSESGIPHAVEAENEDEIGRLEAAFNDMVGKLEAGRRREAEEEALRRDLIAKLSHDLRTPLTAIRGHAYALRREALSDKGISSVALIERKIGYLGQLIENLLSYSLLSAGKYPYRPQRVDIVRFARTLLAGWYPAFEQEQFEIDLELPEETGVFWDVDPQWLERVLDNYLQNVLRHAKEGRYIGFTVLAQDGGAIVIRDRGPGMAGDSDERGAGLGLSIAQLMLKEMRLRGETRSGPNGTIVAIRRM